MIWPWITLALLGVYHGINPAMGWLFAVSRGLQERRGSAVAAALVPIGLGHALAIGLALAIFAAFKASLGSVPLRWLLGAVVIGFGVSKLVRHRHPRWVGMRVGFRDLTLWSFLMATAHGAGLMVLPLVAWGDPSLSSHAPSCHARAGLALSGPLAYLSAALLHTGAMLLASGAIALVVFYKLGLGLLRRAWLNVDRVWAAALVVSGVASLLV
jgi:hypothetical protein